MMKGIVFLAVSFFTVLVWGQGEIEYQNRTLEKALSKEGVSDFSQISELKVADSLLQKHRTLGKFFEVTANAGKYKYIYTGRVNSCRAGGCSISGEKSDPGNGEYFDYFILFDEGKTVQVVKVFNYQATHGYEITARGWLKQFSGHDGSEPLQVNKNIDAISGATISVQAITDDVELKTNLLHKLKM
ncbi:FMN-binding protein [Marinilabilia sp.]|uniref:FMN-binding protein n=1 Tax=Marinilabilia sp. TaxID=2021252 RepID=UPI0025C215B3|nr:FMN-binding protein [Marinilabilia sp.]